MLSPEEYFRPLDEADRDSEDIVFEPKPFIVDVCQRFCRNRMALLGAIVLVIVILFAVFGPMISPYSYDGANASQKYLPCSFQHWMGTDTMGRDTFTRVLYGTRVSLLIGFAATAINLLIGVLYGGISGYAGGWVDMVMMRIVDIIYSIPAMVYMILLMLLFGANVTSVIIGICINGWCNMARIVRSQVMTLKEQEFSVAAYVLGAKRSRILFKHLLINTLGPVIVTMTLMIPQAIFTEAFLSFIGIGISAPRASLGTLAQDAKMRVDKYPLQMAFPIIIVCIVIFALNFIGEGLEQALNPKGDR